MSKHPRTRAGHFVPNRPPLSGAGVESPQVSFRLPRAIYDRLTAEAEQRGVTLSALIRERLIRDE